MKTSERTDQLWPAVVKTRRALKGPKKETDNPGFKRDGKPLKYADLSACIEAADESCFPNGLVTLQEVTSDAAGVAVSTLIVHESGQWVQFDPLFIPASKSDAQGFGSAVSYARRYSLKAAWNMADEDDDGNAAVASAPKKDYVLPPLGLKKPALFDQWVEGLTASAKTMTLDSFRAHYAAQDKPLREYLEAKSPGTLKQMLHVVKKSADAAA